MSDTDHVGETVEKLADLHRQHRDQSTWAQRFTNRVTRVLGRPAAVAVIVALIAGWILGNLEAPHFHHRAIDPATFPDLSLVLGIVAVVLALLTLYAAAWGGAGAAALGAHPADRPAERAQGGQDHRPLGGAAGREPVASVAPGPGGRADGAIGRRRAGARADRSVEADPRLNAAQRGGRLKRSDGLEDDMPNADTPADIEGADEAQIEETLRERDLKDKAPEPRDHSDDFDPGSPAADAPAVF